ncbi:enoyl-CoA hydratase/isomerase family protein [Candidatus Sumerlaeota bacterium]|nr:enoyl-CoA hydratase/isomerase family protein [Candidatus Sumerlaeota bacterium]
MSYETLEIQREGKIAVLILNRPAKRNALSIQTRNEIDAALGELEKEDGAAGVVILGNGPVFCAGFDTKEFANRDPAHIAAMKDSSRRYHRRLAEFPKPLIAGIHGPAFGGGFDLATLCDLRIAAPGAVFAHPEIKFGAPALFGPIKEIIGGGLARELTLTGRQMDAAEAVRAGLVSGIVPEGELRGECIKTAMTIAEAPLAAIKAVKKQIIQSYGGWAGVSGDDSGDGFFDFF